MHISFQPRLGFTVGTKIDAASQLPLPSWRVSS